MQRILFTFIAGATVMSTTCGQESAESGTTVNLTPEQKNLSAFVGTWELAVEGVDERGVAEIRPILGGRFITEDVSIPFGDFDMEWHGVIGHNDRTQQYTGVWFDNANNTTRSSSGESNETGRIITFRGQQAGHGQFIWRISNDGRKTMTIEMFQVSGDGKESLVMKVSGTKQSTSGDHGTR